MTETVLTGNLDAPKTPAAPRAPNAEAAERMYPTKVEPKPEAPPSEVAAVRDATGAARMLYPAHKQYGPELRALALATNPEGTSKGLAQQQVELANVAADIGFDRNDLANLANFAAANYAKPPTADELRASRLTAVRELRQKYGEGFDDAYADAKALAQRDPRFSAYLDKTGLGSHPSVMLRLAELGQSARARGLLPARKVR